MSNSARSDLLGSLAVGGALCLASSPAFSADQPAPQPPPSRRPNILLILTDDQGYGDIASYPPDSRNRDPFLKTPNMDRLAAQSVKFTEGYSVCGICSPSRVGLLTGRYPQHIGYYDNWEEQVGAPRDEMFLSECLKQHGYSTACIGKWHVGRRPGYRPLERGFDRFWGIIQGQHDYFVPSIGEPQYGGGMADGEYPSDQETTVTEMGYFTEELTSRTLEFLDQQARSRNPFFIYLAYTAPHGPFQAPKDLLDKYDTLAGKQNPQRNRARAMLDSLDQGVGKVLARLKEAGLEKDTLVIFLSDNGGHEEQANSMSAHFNGGLRPAKGLLWEGGIRVPFVMRWPGVLPEGKVYGKPVTMLDIWPTVLAAAGLRRPESKTLDGVNLLPYITGKDAGSPHDVLYWAREEPNHRWAVRRGDWKLVYEHVDYAAMRVQPMKYEKGLYNLADDPWEQRNLIADQPKIAQDLEELMREFFSKSKPSIVTPEQAQVWRDEVAKRNERESLGKAGKPR